MRWDGGPNAYRAVHFPGRGRVESGAPRERGGGSRKKGGLHASEKARFYLLHCKCIFYFKTTVVNSIEHAPHNACARIHRQRYETEACERRNCARALSRFHVAEIANFGMSVLPDSR